LSCPASTSRSAPGRDFLADLAELASTKPSGVDDIGTAVLCNYSAAIAG
jgi:hypothetical protein